MTNGAKKIVDLEQCHAGTISAIIGANYRIKVKKMKKTANTEATLPVKRLTCMGFIALSLFIPMSGHANDRLDESRFTEALGATPNIENGKELYKYCVTCHGPEGWGTTSGSYPQIAGQLYTVTIKQLNDIFAKRRGNPIMEAFTSDNVLRSGQDIADLATYIAQMPMTDQNGKGRDRDLALGEKLYEENCTECHGDQGEGNEEDYIPRLQGQHYNYLMRQFSMIRNGHRKNADEKMVKQIENMSLKEQQAIMSYTAKLKPSADDLAEPGWTNPDFPNYDRRWSPQAPKNRLLKNRQATN